MSYVTLKKKPHTSIIALFRRSANTADVETFNHMG